MLEPLVPTYPPMKDTYRASKKEMIGQEFEKQRFNMSAQTMQLRAAVIVDIDVFLLRNGKELIIMQPPRVPHRLPKL